MLSLLSILWALNVDMPLRTLCPQMRRQTHEVPICPWLCWSIFYQCWFQLLLTWSWSLHFRNSSSSLGSTDLSQCCPFFVQMLFRSRLIRTLNGANSPRGSNIAETRDKNFLWVIGVSTSLLVPRQTCRLSSMIVQWSPSTDEPSLPGSTSTCFVLLIDFKSSGIALVTTSLLVIHFFSSNPCLYITFWVFPIIDPHEIIGPPLWQTELGRSNGNDPFFPWITYSPLSQQKSQSC